MNETQAAVLSAALLLSLLANVGLWRLPHLWSHGHACPKCVEHAEEGKRKQEQIKAIWKRDAQRKADQAALQHEVEHKGLGYKDGAPDKYKCRAEWCPRNH